MTHPGVFRKHWLSGVLSLVVSAGAAGASEPPTAWQLLDYGDPPEGESLLVYDTARQREVRVASPSGTWELVGDRWRTVLTPGPPDASEFSCMAYDSGRGVTVLYGTGNQTWEYNGTAWTQRTPATNPGVRQNCAMAYDVSRGKTLLFGGLDGAGLPRSDTWQYDGVNWALLSPNKHPSSRWDHRMAYDSDRARIVLFGGRSGGAFADTWEWDGNNWRDKTPATSPPARWDFGMAFDQSRHVTVLFGGANGGSPYSDTWEWNGTAWAQKTPSVSPMRRAGFALVFDPSRGKVVGEGGVIEYGLNDTWTYNGTTWTQIAITGLPSGRTFFGMSYQPILDAVVLYGGYKPAGGPCLFETWYFQNGSWSLHPEVGAPSACGNFPLTYDAGTNRVTGFSGANPLPIDGLHTLSGSPATWNSIWPTGPTPRIDPSWVNCPAVGGTLLFGGTNTGTYFSDTWLVSGDQFTRLFPANSPTGRSLAPTSCDTMHGQVVLYGGSLLGNVANGETWKFQNGTWVLINGNSPPGARQGHSMVYDSTRGKVVLFGKGAVWDGVTWEFDGSAWATRPTTFQPDSSRGFMQLAYDSEREIVVLFGGESSEGKYNDTWAYGADPDGDGIVGKLDNCVAIANGNQTNGDGDAAGDVCDCAPSDGGSFAVPTEVTGLTATGTTLTTIAWQDMAPAVGPNVVYDLAAGSLLALRSSGGFGGATCLANNLTTPSGVDSGQPSAGDGFYYAARASNICGTGTYGSTSNGANRSITACP
jgi:hypothetical protein